MIARHNKAPNKDVLLLEEERRERGGEREGGEREERGREERGEERGREERGEERGREGRRGGERRKKIIKKRDRET